MTIPTESPPSQVPRLLTKAEAAQVLRVSVRSIEERIKDRSFPPTAIVRIGRCLRFREDRMQLVIDHFTEAPVGAALKLRRRA